MSTISAARPGSVARPATPAAVGSGIAAVAINPVKIAVQYRYWLIAAVIAGIVVGIGAFILLRKFDPQFRATTTYLTLPPLADPTKPEVAFTDREEFERFSATQARILNSERLLRDAVVRDAGASDKGLSSTEWAKRFMRDGKIDPGLATDNLRDIVRARVVTGTSLIELSVTTAVATDAKIICDVIHRAYWFDLTNRGRASSGETRDGISARINTIDGEIRRIDQQIAQRQAERGISGNENTDAQYVRIYMLQPQIVEVTQRFERARTRMITLEAQLKPGQAVLYTDEQRDECEKDPVVLGLKQRLSQIRSEIAAKEQAGFGREHKEMFVLRQLGEQTESELNSERERILRKLFDSEFDRTKQAVTAAEAELKELSRQFNEAVRRREEITRAQTEIELLKNNRQKLLEQQGELQIALGNVDLITGLDKTDRVGRVRRIEESRTPDKLYFPRLEIMLPLGIIAVLGLTLGVILIREIVDQRVKGPSDITMIRGVRLLGIIPSADEDPSRPGSVETAFRDSPTGAVSEGFRQVRSQTVKRMQQAGHKSLLVLAGAPESGASSVVSNLAMGMAASELRVLVIDANFRRPAQHRIFKLAEGPGLGDVLTHKTSLDQAIQQSSIPNLFLLAAGSGPSRAVPERLATETMSQIIKDASAKFDMVIVDTAPAMIAGEGLALANRTDAVAMVVKAFSEKRGLIARLRDQLQDARAEFIGIAVNAVRGSSGGYLRKNIKAASDYQSGTAA